MRISPRLRAGAAALALGGAVLATLAPAIGQDRPTSILPPGFGEPAPAPRATTPAAPRPAASASPRPAPAGGGSVAPAAPGTPGFVQPLPLTLPDDFASPSPTPTPTPTPIDSAQLALYEMPLSARRSLALVGPAGPREGAMPATAFGDADGRYLETLMRRLSAPLPSRWLSIALRRTLAAQLETPVHVGGADFAAERAWLLVRMGEADAARAVVQSVDTANYTPKLLQVAMSALLATGDPAGLCPLVDRGVAAGPARGWILARAMCAGLAGEPARAKALIAAARRARIASGIDLQLAQKVVGAGPGGGQAVTIEWDAVDTLNAWRIGLALATGVALPETLLSTVGPQVTYWRALSPSIAPADRVAAAEAATAQGVLSNAALVDLYGILASDDDATGPAAATGSDLRTAYTAATAEARRTALHSLWGNAATTPYARLVLTAHAAARMPVRAGDKDGDTLVASMLSAGMDRTASRWRGYVASGGDGWAMLQLADPDTVDRLNYGSLSSYAGAGDATLKRQLLFAGMAGLGRLSADDVERGAQALDVRIGAQNAWTRALDRAVGAGQPGTVVLLAGIGMQTGSWRGVPPATLYRIVDALRAVGLGGEARMIAAEAIMRS